MKILLQNKIRLSGHRASVFALAMGKSGRHLLSGAGEGWIVEWDLDQSDTGRVIAKVEENIYVLEYLPATHQIVAGTMHGGVHWIDLKHPERTLNIAHHRKGVYGVLAMGDFLFTAGGDGVLTRWSVLERQSLESLQLSTQSLRALAYSAERKEIAVGASDHNIYFLDASTLAVKSSIEKAHSNSVFCVTYSPDGKRLYSGGRDAMLRVWDLDNEGQNLASIPAHLYTINSMVWHPQGHLFFTASRDKTIKVWDAASLSLLKVLESHRDGGHLNSVNRLLWQGEYLVSASDDRTIILWQFSEEAEE